MRGAVHPPLGAAREQRTGDTLDGRTRTGLAIIMRKIAFLAGGVITP
jgi:hypothetical protein